MLSRKRRRINMSYTTLVGNLVREIEVKTSAKGNSYAFLNLAQNHSERVEENGSISYKEVGPVYWRIPVFGKAAEVLGQSNIPKGTPMFVSGRLILEKMPAYESNGVEYPESVVERILADCVGVCVSEYNSKPIVVGSAKATQQTVEAPQSAPAPKTPAKKANEVVEDVFGDDDDLFGSSDSDDLDDIFA